MVVAAIHPENTLAARLRNEALRVAAEHPEAKPGQRLAWLNALAQTDPSAAIAGLERELEARRPPDGVYLGLLNLRIIHGDTAELDKLCARIQAVGASGPYWLERFLVARRTGHIDLDGMRLAVPPDVIEPRVLRALALGTYESREITVASSIVQAGDRVLELGAGIGAVACATLSDHGNVTWKSVEANPALISVITQNRVLNGVEFELEHAAYGPEDGPSRFQLSRKGFWASSLASTANHDEIDQIEVPGVDGARAIAAFGPNVLIMDIEGAEYGIIARLDLSGINRVLIEFHPDNVDDATHTAALGRLISEGYLIDTGCSKGNVMLFRRS